MAFWVYKCNAMHPKYRGDWDYVFSRSQPTGWGTTEDVPAFARLQEGDVIIACQTDRNELVGLADVTKMRKRGDFLELVVQPIEEFRVALRPLKKLDSRIGAMSIFARGNIGTIYPISTSDAWHLLRVAQAQAEVNRRATKRGDQSK